MLNRSAYKELLDWHETQTAGKRKALLVTGARQIGKSYLVHELGTSHYRSFVEIDLIRDVRAKESLAHAVNPEDLLSRISLLSSAKLDPGSTLIFIDEIQELPDLMSMAKALAQDPRYDFAFSGSPLGVQLKSIRSYPVGFVREVRMFPMTFHEYCDAVGVTEKALCGTGFSCCVQACARLHTRDHAPTLQELRHRWRNAGSRAEIR